jgi:hypothetical protein
MIGRREVDPKIKKLCLATEPATILVTLAWLSLVGLLPSRARLRFTRSLKYSVRQVRGETRKNNYSSYQQETSQRPSTCDQTVRVTFSGR